MPVGLIAIVFTKIDAFYQTLDPGNPIMASAPALPAYDETDGQQVHEQMRALLTEWDASSLDRLGGSAFGSGLDTISTHIASAQSLVGARIANPNWDQPTPKYL